ncbi:MAG: hypothetical protein P4L85_09530 [Paludisphaera borealis]|uniref:DUF6677 family protein n=1 Tax=Paludisphaera borealis TaxID=1387353 RepID=UPI00284E1223|nr:DUF6677 family protein [Paludisphaera borealis]MDR3619579.1 hypothetical protein [Paludisphaera borealis]
MSQQPIPLRDPLRAAFLAWLIPGLGHFYQGRKGKAWLYAICILSIYFVGFALGEGKIVYWRWVNPLSNPEKFSLYYIGQFFAGLPALPALIQGTIRHFRPDSNFLWGFMAEPPQNVINGLHARLGKLVDIGTIYTTAAGLLNVLAIYDAYEGPAYVDEAEVAEAGPTAATAGVKVEGTV